jgi:translocation and assembly module TamA
MLCFSCGWATDKFVFKSQIQRPTPQAVISRLKIEVTGPGQDNIAIRNLLKSPALKLGQALTMQQYNRFKTTLQNTAISQGYFDAHYLEHEVRIKLSSQQAQVILKLNTGKQYHFSHIYFKQSTFSEQFLQRFAPFKSGDAYQQELVNELQSNLASSGYFNSIAIVPVPNKNDYSVPIHVNLSPRPKQQYQLGAGFGTDTGIRALIGWKLRYMGTEGQYLSAQIQAARNYSNAILSYVIPGANPLTDYSSFDLGRTYSDIAPYTATDTAFGFSHVVLHGPWQTSLGLTQHFIQATEPANTTESAQKYLVANAGLNYTKLKQIGYYKQGYAWDIQTQGASQSILSHSSFLQGVLRLYSSISLNQNDRFFIKLSGGAIAVNNLSNLSPLFRFYAGGVDSVRGYSYKSLGPTDSNGNLIGGRYLTTANFNFERRIWHNWSGLVFYDVGNAFNSLHNMDLQKGAGIGASWHSAVGTINFYIAHPVQPVQGPWRFDIGIETLL